MYRVVYCCHQSININCKSNYSSCQEVYTSNQPIGFCFVLIVLVFGVLPLTALEEEEEDEEEVTMAGCMKVGHFWPVTALAQFRTGPYVSKDVVRSDSG